MTSRPYATWSGPAWRRAASWCSPPPTARGRCAARARTARALRPGAGRHRPLRRAREDRPALVLLDLALPDTDGFAVLRQLRAASTVPVILLTVSDAEGDQVRGRELGADDYVTKPFRPGELAARIRAVLRRVGAAAPPGAGLVTVDERLQFDFEERDV